MSNPKDEMCCGEVAEVVLVAIYLQPDPPKLLRWATRDSRTQRRLHYSKSLSKPQTQKTRQKATVENTNVEQGNKVTPARRRLIPHGQNRYKISVFPCLTSFKIDIHDYTWENWILSFVFVTNRSWQSIVCVFSRLYTVDVWWIYRHLIRLLDREVT